jgi:hypothetical protein
MKLLNLSNLPDKFQQFGGFNEDIGRRGLTPQPFGLIQGQQYLVSLHVLFSRYRSELP